MTSVCQMRDSHRDRVVLVVMRYGLSYLEEHVEHARDLLLVGLAVAGRRALHLPRRIFERGDAGGFRSVKDGTAYFRDVQGRLLVGIEEKPLHRERIRPVFRYEVDALIDDKGEAFREFCRAGCFDTVRIDPLLLA